MFVTELHSEVMMNILFTPHLFPLVSVCSLSRSFQLIVFSSEQFLVIYRPDWNLGKNGGESRVNLKKTNHLVGMSVSLWESKKRRFDVLWFWNWIMTYSPELEISLWVYITPSSAIAGFNGIFPWWTWGLLNVGLSTNEALRTIKGNDERSMFINLMLHLL